MLNQFDTGRGKNDEMEISVDKTEGSDVKWKVGWLDQGCFMPRIMPFLQALNLI